MRIRTPIVRAASTKPAAAIVFPEAVGWRKRRELTRSAQVWIDRCGEPGAVYRFDVVAVLVEARTLVRVRHVEDAFRAFAVSSQSGFTT